jgi:hypothetical protein
VYDSPGMLVWRLTARAQIDSLPPQRLFDGVSLLLCEQPLPKDPEKVGKTGPSRGQGSGVGQEDKMVLLGKSEGRGRDGVGQHFERPYNN